MPRTILIQGPDGQMKTVPLTGGDSPSAARAPPNCAFPKMPAFRASTSPLNPRATGWTVEDLGSKNGTFVNSIPLKARLILKPGDRITAGHLVIVFRSRRRARGSGVVVFEGGEVRLRQHFHRGHQPGGRALQPDPGHRARRRQGLGAHAGAHPRRPGTVGESAAGGAFPGDSRSRHTGRQRAARRAAAARRRELVAKAHKGEGFRISHRRARPRAQRKSPPSWCAMRSSTTPSRAA